MSAKRRKRVHHKNQSKNKGQDVNGLLLLDKPAGITSNGALQQVKKLLDARKAGHTGSLDPIATGLLPICFGESTKLSNSFLNADKVYWTRIKFGEVTETGDSEGQVLSNRPVTIVKRDAQIVLDEFKGQIEQVPPMYSALKHNGEPLYKLARQGIEVERKPRMVNVYELELLDFQPPNLDIRIHCSSGFYVRSLAYDLGERLGCGGHVIALRRLGVGALQVEKAVTLAQIEAICEVSARQALVIPGDQALNHLPEISLSEDAAFYLCRGQPVRAAQLPDAGVVRLYARGGGFLGLGEVLDDGRVAPKRLFRAGNVSS